jgi:hypothetical protein
MPSKRQDDEANARKAQIEVTSGAKTINEHRSELGLPLLDTPQADMPILVSAGGMYLFGPDGLIDPSQTVTAPQLESNGETNIIEPKVEVAAEVKAFMKWANKGRRNRDFEFKTIDPVVAEALNRCAMEGDLETARSLAKAYIS